MLLRIVGSLVLVMFVMVLFAVAIHNGLFYWLDEKLFHNSRKRRWERMIKAVREPTPHYAIEREK
ncbi:MAG: hypothetical protein ISS36_03300 [Candidatus Aenigmarchaeota archaeon]|nr:hypothetical protein [Candidatus Aenigmarchaeota archaeon]